MDPKADIKYYKSFVADSNGILQQIETSFGNEIALKAYSEPVTKYPSAAEIDQILAFYLANVTEVRAADDSVVGYLLAIQLENSKIQVFKFSVPPFEFVITYDTSTKTIAIKVYVVVPFIGNICIGEVSGNLDDGISVTVGYKGVVSGTVGIKLGGTDKKNVILYWNITAFGKSYDGSVVIFKL